MENKLQVTPPPAMPTPQAEPAVAEQARFFEGYLCRAWGETDLPAAEVVPDMEGVRRFMVREWLGEENATGYDGTPTLPPILEEIESRDWRDEGVYSIEFEIGGVSVERVTGTLASQSTPPPAAIEALPTGHLYRAINNLLTHIGIEGSIDSQHGFVGDCMDALHAIDGGIYLDNLAKRTDGSSTPPPESAGQSQMARDMIADMNGEIEG